MTASVSAGGLKEYAKKESVERLMCEYLVKNTKMKTLTGEFHPFFASP